MGSDSVFTFRVHDERLAIARLETSAAFPGWAQGRFFCVARTSDELSVVCAQARVPVGVRHERDKLALGIVGVIPMTTVGLLAALCAALATVRVPVFVLSTHDTDWLLVDAAHFEAARTALEGLGHHIVGAPPPS